MNTLECIADLARQNGKRAGAKRAEDVVGKGVPYIHVYRDGGAGASAGRWVAVGGGHKGHDNEPRMDLYTSYLTNAVFPNIKEGNIGGYYNIELHDSYTYLGRDRSLYKDCLVFSRFKDDSGPILIPDPYMVVNWGSTLSSIVDTVPWDAKQDRACFYGTTTGDRNPDRNRRIQMCLWAAGRTGYDFKITNVAQMSLEDILGARSVGGVEGWARIYSQRRVSIGDQMMNRYMFLPDGNTCKFDVWNWKTGMLGLKDKSRDMMWYYPMMRDGEHFAEVDENTIDAKMAYYSSNKADAERVVKNANRLAHELFKPFCHMYYTTALFEAMAENNI